MGSWKNNKALWRIPISQPVSWNLTRVLNITYQYYEDSSDTCWNHRFQAQADWFNSVILRLHQRIREFSPFSLWLSRTTSYHPCTTSCKTLRPRKHFRSRDPKEQAASKFGKDEKDAVWELGSLLFGFDWPLKWNLNEGLGEIPFQIASFVLASMLLIRGAHWHWKVACIPMQAPYYTLWFWAKRWLAVRSFPAEIVKKTWHLPFMAEASLVAKNMSKPW